MFSDAVGQVVLENQAVAANFPSTGLSGGDPLNGSLSFTTQSAPFSLLLVAISAENWTPSSVSYDGSTVTSSLIMNTPAPGVRRQYLYIVDLGSEVGTTADITVNGTLSNTSAGFNFAAFQISNATTTGFVTNTASGADPLSLTLNSVPNGGFVLDWFVQNNNANGISATGATRDGIFNNTTGNYGSGGSFGWIENASSTSYTLGWDGANNQTVLTAVAFAAVPEPSSLALLTGTVAGVAFLRRRRRSCQPA